MKNRARRVSTRVYDRKIDRNVCRVQLKKHGVPKPNKKVKYHWREYSE